MDETQRLVHIKRITIQGFKSFGPKRTAIKLEKGFVVITGPNGGGKSNVLDAIKFSLGELSVNALRVSKLSDLIHESNGRKLSAATVTLVLDNSDRSLPIETDEVALSRTLLSTGESVYRLNGRALSRNDILSILAASNIRPSGFNIITQGAVLSIAEKSSEELRKMIEEVAGTTEYDKKKAEAMKELESAERNVAVARAGVAELRNRVKQLERERSQLVRSLIVQRYLEQLQRRQLEAEQGLVGQTISEINAELEKAGKAREELRELVERLSKERDTLMSRVNEVEHQIAVFQSKINDIRLAIESYTRQADHLKTSITREARVYAGSKRRLLALMERRTQLMLMLEEERAETAKIEENLAKSVGELEDLNRRLKHLTSLSESISKSIREGRAVREEQERNARMYLAMASDLESKLLVTEKRIVDLERRGSELSQIVSSLSSAIAEKEAHLQDLEKRRVELSGLLSQTEREHRLLLERISNTEQLLSECNSLVEEASRIRGEVQGQLDRLDRGRKIMSTVSTPEKSGLRRLQELINKHNNSSSPAWPVLAQHLDTIVVEGRGLAAAMAEEAAELGASLSVVGVDGAELEVGHDSECLACSLAGEDQSLRRVLHAIFPSHRFSRESLYREGYPTLTASGVYSNGYGYFTTVPEVLSYQRLSEARKKIDEVLEAIGERRSQLSGTMSSLKKEIGHLEEKLIIVKTDVGKLSLECSALIQEIGAKKEERMRAEEELRRVMSDFEMIREEKRNFEYELARVRRELASLEAAERMGDQLEESERRLATLSGEVREVERGIGVNETLARSLKQRLEENHHRIINHGRELDRLESDIMTSDLASSNSKQRVRRLAEEYRASIQQLEERKKEYYQLSESVHSLLKLQAELRSRLTEVETALNSRRSELAELEAERGRLQVRIMELRMREAIIGEKLEAIRTPQIRDLDMLPSEYKDYLRSELQGELAGIGMVNQLSLEQYPQLASEYMSRSRYLQVLDQERLRILEIIKMIDSKKLEAFMRTFSSVSSGFGRFFEALTGGSSWLELTDPDRPLESGVEMITAFPGKAARSSKSVSGGEKSIAAVALLLAFQGLTPAEFLILDEIDAHMDANYSRKLAELLGEFSKTSQVITVSLKDIVAERADQLIGVYNQGGESKVVITKLEEN
jgi:chromosome segregation protein